MRVTGYRRVIEMLRAKGPLRSGLDVESAADVLVTLLGPGIYVTLTAERGWSHDQVVTWLQGSLPDVLLERT